MANEYYCKGGITIWIKSRTQQTENEYSENKKATVEKSDFSSSRKNRQWVSIDNSRRKKVISENNEILDPQTRYNKTKWNMHTTHSKPETDTTVFLNLQQGLV